MSRGNNSSLRRRPTRTVPASITAVVLVLIGAAVVVAVGARLATGSTDATTRAVQRWLAGLGWNDAVMVTAAVGAVVLGLVMIIAALRPGRRDALQLAVADAGTGSVHELDAVLPRRALGRLLAARVGSVDGVNRVDAEVDERRVLIQVGTATRYTEDVKQQVTATVEQALAETGLQKVPRHRVLVRMEK